MSGAWAWTLPVRRDGRVDIPIRRDPAESPGETHSFDRWPDLSERYESPHRRSVLGQEDLRVDVAVCRNAASSRSGLTFLPYSGLQGVVANR